MYLRWQNKWLIINRVHIEQLETSLKQVGLIHGMDFYVHFPSPHSTLLNDLEQVFDMAVVFFIADSDVLAKMCFSGDGFS
jgi:hypothetical protein